MQVDKMRNLVSNLWPRRRVRRSTLDMELQLENAIFQHPAHLSPSSTDFLVQRLKGRVNSQKKQKKTRWCCFAAAAVLAKGVSFLLFHLGGFQEALDLLEEVPQVTWG